VNLSDNIEIRQFAERAYLVSWTLASAKQNVGFGIDLTSKLKQISKRDLKDYILAETSLLIHFNDEVDKPRIVQLLKALEFEGLNKKAITTKTHHIPVCYHSSLALDIDYIEESTGLKEQNIIALHSNRNYHVQMNGFLPGFSYMSSLDKRLFLARKSEPRLRTPKGSVAIAGKQTAIYPAEVPGGWHVIGRSPTELFDWSSGRALFNPGDSVSFYEISLAAFLAWQ